MRLTFLEETSPSIVQGDLAFSPTSRRYPSQAHPKAEEKKSAAVFGKITLQTRDDPTLSNCFISSKSIFGSSSLANVDRIRSVSSVPLLRV